MYGFYRHFISSCLSNSLCIKKKTQLSGRSENQMVCQQNLKPPEINSVPWPTELKLMDTAQHNCFKQKHGEAKWALNKYLLCDSLCSLRKKTPSWLCEVHFFLCGSALYFWPTCSWGGLQSEEASLKTEVLCTYIYTLHRNSWSEGRMSVFLT